MFFIITLFAFGLVGIILSTYGFIRDLNHHSTKRVVPTEREKGKHATHFSPNQQQ